MNYVDTSLVVTALDRSEPARSAAATRRLDGSTGKAVSELFLVELASAISRKEGLVEAASVGGVPPPGALLAYLVFVMSKYDLRLVEATGDRVFTPLGRVGAEAGSSLGLAADVKLRSLDLLHLAHLLSFKGRGHAVEALLTSDSEFRKAEGLLRGHGVRVVLLEGR